MIEQIEIGNATDDMLKVTLRGKAEDIVKTLANGLSRESLVALKDAIEAEMSARSARPE